MHRFLTALILACCCALPAGASERLRFSGWSLLLPEGLVAESTTPDKLVLRLAPGRAGRATITLHGPQPVPSNPEAWLAGQWKKLGAGHQFIHEEDPGEAFLADGTSGLRRSANTQGGQGILQADAFIEQGKLYLVVGDVAGDAGVAAYFALLAELQFKGAPAAAATAKATSPGAAPPRAASASTPTAAPRPSAMFAHIKPAQPLRADASASMDWKGPAVSIRTSADLREVNVRTALPAFIRDNKKLMGDVPLQPVSHAAAMAKVRKLVGADKNRTYLEKLKNHPDLQQPGALIQLAAAQLSAGRPAESLASLLVAQQKWPDDGQVSFNMAAVLADAGLANESQALLAEMKRRAIQPDPPYGIGPAAATDYLQGYNSMRLGQFHEAATLLRQVVASEPYFAESALSLALVEAQLGGDPRKHFLQGYYRRPAKLMKPQHTVRARDGKPDAGLTRAERAEAAQEELEFGDIVALPAIHFVDLSRGQPGSLPHIQRPAGVEAAMIYYYGYAEAVPKHEAQLNSAHEAARILDERWRKKIRPGQRLEYYEAILRVFSPANARIPEMATLLQDEADALHELAEADAAVAEPFMEELQAILARHAKEPPVAACPEIRGLVADVQSTLLARAVKADLATRRVQHLWHRYATALAGMARDPDFRAYLKAEIEANNAVTYYGLLTNLLQATNYSPFIEQCVELERQALEDANRAAAQLAPCDDKVKESQSWRVGFFKMERTCEGTTYGLVNDLVKGLELFSEVKFDRDGWVQEKKSGASYENDAGKVSVEVTTDKDGGFKEVKASGEISMPGSGPLSGKKTAEISRDSKGSTTIYTGTKVGAEVKGWGVKVGASAEEGSGTTYNSDGRVTSTFTKTTTEVSGQVGGIGSSSKTETIIPGPSVNRGQPVLPEFRG